MTYIDVARHRPPDSADVTGLDVPVGPRAAGAALDAASDGRRHCSQRDAPYAAMSDRGRARPHIFPATAMFLPGLTDWWPTVLWHGQGCARPGGAEERRLE